MSWLLYPESWIAFITLVTLEIVLGVDNVIFISILASKLPKRQQARARVTGLAVAVVSRLLLLLSLSWIISLTQPLFTIQPFNFEVAGRDLILFLGGLFLIAKATLEIHQRLEGAEGQASAGVKASFTSVILQVLLLDVVFSLDSVITAVGMVNDIPIMASAVIVAALLMMVAAGPLSNFVEKHPTIKMLALSFLLLIGFALVADGLHQHISKGYIYFAMGFSVLVEMLNLRAGRPAPVKLHEPYVADERK